MKFYGTKMGILMLCGTVRWVGGAVWFSFCWMAHTGPVYGTSAGPRAESPIPNKERQIEAITRGSKIR
jgi:hypothetical protein